METLTTLWTPENGWDLDLQTGGDPRLILYFGNRKALGSGAIHELGERFPDALVCGCSTSGEIHGATVHDGAIVAALCTFHGTRVHAVSQQLPENFDSREVGRQLAENLIGQDLKHVLLLSDGIHVNGSALIEGFQQVLPPGVIASGGLAGDGSHFGETLVGLGDCIKSRQIVAIGFYGPHFDASFGACGGWEAFGPRRLITRSEGNTVFELDGQPALQLYKRYLGELASGLPATGLLFPLGLVRGDEPEQVVVRTILGIDEATQSVRFAGDMPEGTFSRLMKASAEQLIDGAAEAAEIARPIGDFTPSLALLVSCVGRRLVLGQRAEDELEAVLDNLPPSTPTLGFYSYGEVCPHHRTGSCALHNQTMTVILLGENV
ncbi:hypothetical protein HNR46_001122 [Haloferula luteola]|uniref:FIST N domain protein n=1 Tax=Haloferula luteola TaxID=595692 RepID=A0A840V826_9BACT|nr:FIST N-terminal domain-containing protein [Haloferula luteola]MBB5350888.1 hypothetical protein [Haloferula luteola]